jgi:cytoplasmic iron level regulating protein YaaA (DUF328/UPF0246 family)
MYKLRPVKPLNDESNNAKSEVKLPKGSLKQYDENPLAALQKAAKNEKSQSNRLSVKDKGKHASSNVKGETSSASATPAISTPVPVIVENISQALLITKAEMLPILRRLNATESVSISIVYF